MHHTQSACAKGDHYPPFASLDRIERLLINRFLPPKGIASPSRETTHALWLARIQSLIKEKAHLHATPNTTDPQILYRWIEQSAAVVSTPVQKPFRLSLSRPNSALAINKTNPLPEFGMPEPRYLHHTVALLVLASALMGALSLLDETAFGSDSISQRTDQILKIIGTATTIFIPAASLYLTWKRGKN